MIQTMRHSLVTFLLLLLAPHLVRSQLSLPPSADVQEDTAGQVTINPDPTSNDTAAADNLPITATIFSGAPGSSKCRGGVLFQLNIAPPSKNETTGEVQLGEKKCYNMLRPVGCANFVASKEAGCEARLFAEGNCKMFVNVAVFVPEKNRAVGGLWRSMSIQCGIRPPDPDSLGEVPFSGLIRNKKGG
ncbi:hypothetical protein QBC43DRAFT_321044 [Cladorrhinum sp. PSN259]|nr:hypothetical protein QBC43DRAFT_321044 [Cladorrhinum sp. PSN259]